MDEGEERAYVEARFGAFGPWTPAASDLPPGGPRRLWWGADAVAWLSAPGRWRAERAGRAALEGHPARPAIRDEDERGWVLAPYGAAVDDPVATVRSMAGGAPTRLEETRRALLSRWVPELAVGRALGRVGLARREVDRWLDAVVVAETVVGPSLGGLRAGWWRRQDGRPVALRWDRARPDGALAMDLAGLTLDAVEDDAAREAHRAGLASCGAADEAFAIARVAVWLREHAIGKRDAAAARVRAAIGAPEREPSTVRVWIEGPPCVPPDLWHAPGEAVSASRARWLLAHLDDRAVAGGRLRVRTEPPIRAGRRAPQREPRSVRRRRLFRRWDEGIRVDDEGLASATPEALAMRIAEGASGVVIDGTAGVGALTIALARQPGVARVVAVELDPARLAMARHNARVYGVEDRIEHVAGDVVELLDRLAPADLLVLDPPWGGRGYDRERVALDDLPMDVRGALARHPGAVILKLPRSFDPATLPPGRWRLEPLVDERGILKMLVARRDPVR